MDRYVEDGLGLLVILLLLPVMLFIVWPAAYFFDRDIGVLRRTRLARRET